MTSSLCLSLSLCLPVSAASIQRVDLLLHQHHWRVHPLPRRGLTEAGLPGDAGVHPGPPPLPEGEPATGTPAWDGGGGTLMALSVHSV